MLIVLELELPERAEMSGLYLMRQLIMRMRLLIMRMRLQMVICIQY
jgi:hypothetical protein